MRSSVPCSVSALRPRTEPGHAEGADPRGGGAFSNSRSQRGGREAHHRPLTAFASADLRFAAWLAWMTPFDTALSSFLDATRSAAVAASLSRNLARRGHEDANLRVIMMVALGLLVPGTLAPLMPSPFLALAMLAPVCLFNNAYFGCATAAIQLATPVEVRATASALFMLFISIAGMAVGSVAVPLVDLWLFTGDGSHIGASLSIVTLVSSVLAAGTAYLGLKPYGKLASDDGYDHRMMPATG